MNLVAVSGGFDPLHNGHVSMIKEAATLGKVVVILNSDDWLIRKKGFFFQSWEERKAILEELNGVWGVAVVDDSDDTVCEALERLKPDMFINGGDRLMDNVPEVQLCNTLKIQMLFNVGYSKTQSSTAIARKAIVKRDWGEYHVLAESTWYKVKRLLINPHTRLSKQKHWMREEYWFFDNGQMDYIGQEDWHMLRNPSDEVMEVIEVQIGQCEEDDIERK